MKSLNFRERHCLNGMASRMNSEQIFTILPSARRLRNHDPATESWLYSASTAALEEDINTEKQPREEKSYGIMASRCLVR